MLENGNSTLKSSRNNSISKGIMRMNSLSPRTMRNKTKRKNLKLVSNRKSNFDQLRKMKSNRPTLGSEKNSEDDDDLKDQAIIESKHSSIYKKNPIKENKNDSKKRSFSPKFLNNLDFLVKNRIKEIRNNNDDNSKIYNSNFNTSREDRNSPSNTNNRFSLSPNSWVKNLSQRLSSNRKDLNNNTLSTLDFITLTKIMKKSPKGSPKNSEDLVYLSTDNVIKKLKEGRIEKNMIEENEQQAKKYHNGLNLNNSSNQLKIRRDGGNLGKMSKMLERYSQLEINKAKNFTQKLNERFMKKKTPKNKNSSNQSKSIGSPKNQGKMKFDTSNELESRTKSKITQTPKSNNSVVQGEYPKIDFKKVKKSLNSSLSSARKNRRKSKLENIQVKSNESSFVVNSDIKFFKKSEVTNEEIKKRVTNNRKKLFLSFDKKFQKTTENETSCKKKKKRCEPSSNGKKRRKKIPGTNPISRKFTKVNNNKNDKFSVRNILKGKEFEKTYKIKISRKIKFNFLELQKNKNIGKSQKILNQPKVSHLKRPSIQVELQKVGLSNTLNSPRKMVSSRSRKSPNQRDFGFKFSTKNSIKLHSSRVKKINDIEFPMLENETKIQLSGQKMFRSFNGKFKESNTKPASVMKKDLDPSTPETPKKINKNKKRSKIKSFDINSSRLGSLNNQENNKKKIDINLPKYATRTYLKPENNTINEDEKIDQPFLSERDTLGLRDLFFRKKELLKNKKTSVLLSSRASVSTIKEKTNKFRHNSPLKKLGKSVRKRSEESLRNPEIEDQRIMGILGYSITSRKKKKMSEKKSPRNLRVGSMGTMNLPEEDSSSKKNDSFIYKQYTQPCNLLKIDEDKCLLRGTSHSNIEIGNEKQLTKRSRSGDLNQRSTSKTVKENPKSPREFKKKHNNLLESFTSKRYNKIKIDSTVVKSLKVYNSNQELDSRAKTSNDPSTQATNDNMVPASKIVTTNTLKGKYSLSPCDYYMKDLLFALKNGMKQPKAFRYYEHFLYNTKTQLLINKNKEILSNKHTKDLEFEAKKIYLPPLKKKGMKTLVLDLDETLIHCNADSKEVSDAKIPIKVKDNSIVEVGINFRPFVNEFLENMSKEYEIVIFTASHPCYANKVLDILDSNNQFISYRVFRNHCVHTESGISIKDLRIFANRKIENIILVDNALYSYALQPYNGIPIVPFYSDKKDAELSKLAEFLKEIKDVDNIRSVIKTVFRVDLFKKFASRVDILSRKLLSLYKGNV